MKKILEVLEYGNSEIIFKSDIDVAKNPQIIGELIPKIMFSMSTKLFGNKELNIFAIIRALIMADLALSNNRKEMIKMMDEESKFLGKAFRQTMSEMEKQGKASWIPNTPLGNNMMS